VVFLRVSCADWDSYHHESATNSSVEQSEEIFINSSKSHVFQSKNMVLQLNCAHFTPIFVSLKITVYILSAFLLSLSCYPCVQDNCDEHDELASAVSHGEQEDSNDQDACTPFCIDGCCPTHLLCQINTPAIVAPFITDNVPSIFFREPSVKNVDHSIWQPPRLS